MFVNRVSIGFIVLFRGVPKLADWKSVVLINAERTMSLISRQIHKESYNVYRMSVSISSFEAEVVVGREVEF